MGTPGRLLLVGLFAAGPAWVPGCQRSERTVNVEVERENGHVEKVEVDEEGPVEKGAEAAVKGTGKGIEKAGEGMNRAGEWMQEKAD